MGLHQPSRTHLAPRPLCRPFLFLKASQTRNIRNMICHGAQPCVCCMLSHFSHVQLFVTPWTVAYQAPLSMGFSRQEYWSGLPCPPSRGSFQSRDQTQVSRSAGEFFNNWEATRVAQELVKNKHYFSSLNCVPSKKICPKVQFL